MSSGAPLEDRNVLQALFDELSHELLRLGSTAELMVDRYLAGYIDEIAREAGCR